MDLGARPARDVQRLAGGREPVGPLVQEVFFALPGAEPVALGDGRLEQPGEPGVGLAQLRLERGDAVEAEQALVRVVQQLAQCRGGREPPPLHPLPNGQHRQAVLGDRERQLPAGMPAPAVGARQPGRQILVGPGVWPEVQQVEAAAGAEPHPGASSPHASALRVSTWFQSFQPSGGVSRSDGTPALAAISARNPA